MGTTSVSTILFTDLVGSTEMASRLGDERTDQLRRDHFSALRSMLASHGGTEVKNLGDGLMLTFGSPSQAVACAVGMQQAVAARRRLVGERLSMRVGISVGEASIEEGDYFGRPVIEAARLCAAAGADQILVSDMVRVLAAGRAGHDFESVGPLSLKGLREPVAAWEVPWKPARHGPLPLPARLRSQERITVVGRTREKEALSLAWRRTHEGIRQTFLISGEPGIGKSCLATHMALTANEDAGLVLVGGCDEELALPYQPFVEALDHMISNLPENELIEVMAGRGRDLARLVRDVARRLPDLPPPQVADPETERYLLFRAVADVLAAASRRHPVLLLLEDLHWAGKATLLMLRYLIASAEPMPLLVIGTYRDSDLDRTNPLTELLADLRRVPGVERLNLHGLSDAETMELMEEIAGGPLKNGNRHLARTIFTETDGSPFFVRELLRHLAESGVLVDDGNQLTASVDISAISIPDSIREVISRRLSRLPPAVERLLSRAAVIGPQFDLAVVASLSGMSRADAIDALEVATEAALAREVPGVPGRFEFAHALIRNTLYEQLGLARRMELHRAVAETLESIARCRENLYVDELAHHWQAATVGSVVDPGDRAKASFYAERAGQRAMRSLAYEVASRHFQAAIEAGRGVLDAIRHCELLVALGEAQRCAGDSRHRETLLEASRIAIELGDARRAARAALANQRGLFSRIGAIDEERVAALEAVLATLGPTEPALRGRLLALLASELHWGDWERRVELGREALATVRSVGDPGCVAEVLAAVWFATWGVASASERAAIADELAEMTESLADRTLQFYATMALFLSASERADMERADAALDACVRIAEELGQPVLLWRAANLRLNRSWSAGRCEQMDDLTEESIRLGRAAGQPDAVPHAIGPRVFLRILQGRVAEALELVQPLTREFPRATTYRAELAWAYGESGRLDEARALLVALRGDGFSRLPRDYLRLVNLSILARASSRVGWVEAAKELYDLLSPYAGDMVVGQTAWLGPVDHDLAVLSRALGRHHEATEHFATAVDVQERIGARIPLLSTRIEWGRLAVERGDEQTARWLLNAARTDAEKLALDELLCIVENLLTAVA